MADYNVGIALNARDNASAAFRNVGQSMTGLQTTARNVSSSLGSLGGVVAAGLGAFMGNQVIQTMGELRALGDEIGDVRALFEQVGGAGEAGMEQLRGATRGVVSDLELMRGAAKLSMLGMASDSGEASEMMGRAVSLGLLQGIEDSGAALDSYINTLNTQSSRALAQFGVNIQDFKARVDALMAGGMSQADAWRQAFDEAADGLINRMGPALDDQVGAWDRLTVRIENAKGAIAEFIATGLESGAALIEMLGIMANSLPGTQTAVSAAGGTWLATLLLGQQGGTVKTPQQLIAEMFERERYFARLDQGYNPLTTAWTRQGFDAWDKESWAERNPLADMQEILGWFEGWGPGNLGGRQSVGDQVYMTEEDLNNARENLQIMQDGVAEMRRQMVDFPSFISEDDIHKAEEYVAQMEQVVEYIEKGHALMQSMSLSTALGTDAANPLLAQGTDALLGALRESGMGDTEIGEIASALNLISGRETELSQLFDEALPAWAALYEEYGQKVGNEAFVAMLEGIRLAEAGMGPMPTTLADMFAFGNVGLTGGGAKTLEDGSRAPWSFSLLPEQTPLDLFRAQPMGTFDETGKTDGKGEFAQMQQDADAVGKTIESITNEKMPAFAASFDAPINKVQSLNERLGWIQSTKWKIDLTPQVNPATGGTIVAALWPWIMDSLIQNGFRPAGSGPTVPARVPAGTPVMTRD